MKNKYSASLLLTLSSLFFCGNLLAQVPSYVPTNGLVGWWPFNGNANDESGNGNNGTVNGATLTTDRFGVANGAYGFNGINCCGTPDPVQEIVIANQFLNLGQNFTVSCWMSSSQVTKFQQLLFFAGAAVELNNEHVPSKLTYAVGPGTSWDLLYAQGTNTNFQNNTWYHVLFTKVGTTYSLYLNGSLEGTSVVSASANYNQTIGMRIGCLAGGHELFKGSLDDFGVWNRSLNSSEIQALINAPATPAPPSPPTLAVSPASTTICAGSSTTLSATANSGSTVCASSQLPTGLQSGLVGYWPFCGNANDASGNGNNGTVNGATLTTDRFGNASSAYSFDGNLDFISATQLSTTTNFTTGVWVKMSSLTGYLDNQTIIVRNNNQFWDIGYDQPSGKIFFGVYNGNWSKVYSPIISLNQWVHLTAVFQGSNSIKIYMNGVLSESLSINFSNFSNLNNLLFFGGEDSSPNKSINGQIDDFVYYNRILTQAEIQTLYNLGQATYSWSPGGATTSSITVAPTSTTTYTCTATANGVSSTATSVVTVTPAPSITATNTSICAGQSTTLTASTTSTGSGSNCPTLSGSLATGLVGYWPFCGNANDASGNGNNGTVNGATLTTDRFGNANSAYFFPNVFPTYIQLPEVSTSLGAINTSSAISIWSKSDHLTLYGVMLHASSSNSHIFGRIEENSTSKIKIYHRNPQENDEPVSIESSNSNDWNHYVAIIDASSGTYKFYVNGVEWTSMQFSYNPSNSYYNNNRTWQIGCITSDQSYHQFTGKIDDIAIWNRALTTSEIQALYTTGQTTYSWSNGATTPSITVSPTTTTTYTCTVTDPSETSCVATQTITVNPVPTVNAGADISVCSGSTATLTATGATTYSWTNNVQNGVAFTPIATTTYTVTGTDANGCTSTDAVTVTVVPAPTISATNTTVCAGQSTTLTASTTATGSGSNCPTLSGSLATGIVGYWPFCGNANDASGNGNNGTVNGATLTTDRFGNANSAYSFDGVNDNIIVNSLSSTNSINYTISVWANLNTGYNNGYPQHYIVCWNCAGNGVYLNIDLDQVQFCCGNLTLNQNINEWNHFTVVKSNGVVSLYKNGSLITTNSNATQLINSIYSLYFGSTSINTEFTNGKIDDIAIWNRALTASEIQALYTTGQTTYSWSNGATTPSITVSPTTTTTYTCTVTDPSGTSCVATQTITVNPVPTVNAGADISVCSGSTATLTATGAATYSWTNNVQNGVAFTPIATTTYTVTGTDANGCTATDGVAVTVIPTPIITTTNTTVCAGQSTTLTASTTSTGSGSNCPTLSGSLTTGLVGYWPFCGNANDASGNGNNGTVNGATLTTDRFGSANSAYSFDGVNDFISIPFVGFPSGNSPRTVSIWALPTSIDGQFRMLYGYGNYSNTNSFSFGIYQTTNTFYYSSHSNDIISQVAQQNQLYHIVVSYDGLTYQIYINGLLISSGSVPTNTILNTLYIGRDESGGYFIGKLDDIAIWNRALTASEIQALYTTGQTTYAWSNGATTPSITVSPTSTTTYTCTVTDPSGTSCVATQTITVNPTPTVNAGADISVCSGSTATLTATGAATYSWTNNVQNGVAFTPIATTTYTVTGTDANGCTATDGVAVTVIPTPIITTTNTTVCAGQSTTLSINAGQPSSSNCIGNLGSPNPWPFPTAANAGYIPLGTFGAQTAFSVSMWINPSQTQNGVSIILDASHGGSANWVIQSINSGATWAWGSGEFSLTPNVWQHLLITYNNGSRKVFVNGAQVLSWTQLMSYSGTPALTLGNWTEGGRRFNGLIDELYITTDILQTANFTPESIIQNPSAATFGLWHFDEGTGTSTSNISSVSYPLNNWYWATRSISSGPTSTVVWSPGGNSTSSITVSPTTTTTYTCTVTDPSGTSCAATQTITVVPSPTITATNTTVCAGQSTTLTASTTSTGSGSNCPTLSGSLITGLVGYWPFCGNANDASGNGNNGTVNGATLTTDRFGSANSAYSFNGSNSIDIGVNGFSTGNNQATLSGWVYITTNPAGVSYIVGYGNPNVSGSVFATGIYGAAGLFGTFSGAVYDAISNINCPLNSWNLVTTVKETNGTVKIYLNGNLIFTQTVATPLLNNVSGRIGRAVWNSSEYWNGKIDDVAIWNRALSASEVLALYNNGQTTYAWSNGATTPSITVLPSTTTTYTCTVTDANGNSCTATQTITVVPFNGVNAGTDQTICAGGTVTLAATGATTYSWNNNVQNGVAFSPISSSSYIVTGTQNGCTDTDTVLVTVVADPTITNPVAASYCQNGGPVTPLTVNVAGGISSAYSYQWYANTTVNNFGGTAILGATTATYTPPISTVGTTYYYCTVAQAGANSGCLSTSGANAITVAAQPTITSQPVSSQNGCIGASLTTLSISVTGGNGAPSFQWYSNTTLSTSGGTAIPGANNSSYSAQNSSAGTNYFYCIATYPNATSCATQTSNVATITLTNDPIFTVAPHANQSVCVGGSIPALTFSSTGGSGTSSYQWYTVNGSTYTTILGATGPSYTPPTFTLPGSYAYAVAITQTGNGCASGFSSQANVTVLADPNVSSPSAANYCQGGAVTNPLTVSATGGINSAYTYQWYSNGANNNTSGIVIPGATTANYTPPTSTIGTLYYYCQVSQGSGCLSSSPTATITVVAGPALSSQPLGSQSVCVGATLNAYSVSYNGGTGTPSYQWYSSTTNSTINGTAIAGAVAANFTPGANAVGQTYYYCVISFNALSGCSSLTSNAGQVNILANPTFSISPIASQTICQGANPQVLSFATTGGAGNATYQWYNVVNNNYTPIIGANGLTYTPSASLPAGTYNYAVAMTQIASGCSTGFSSNSQLVVLPQPVVSTPQGGVYCQGGTIGQPLSVSVTGGNGSSTYQWYQSTTNNNSGGTAINGATNSSFTPSLANFGTLYYYCVVSQNAGCTATSAVATVVSNPSPVISTQPTVNQTVCVGSSPTPLTTSYTGGVGTPSYQWYVNSQNTTLGGSPIGGATSNTYIPSNQVGLGSNYYYCVVTLSNSSCPQATTNVATVNTVANPSLNGPVSATYCQSTGAAQPLSVSASGGNGTTYNYQWYNNVNNANFGGSQISGATNPSYSPPINGSSTYYYCVVTQPGGCLSASAVASVAIVPAPSITSQPLVGQTLCIGGSPQTLSITTTGGVANPSYQWYSNTVNTLTNAQAITNANSANFSPAAVSSTGTTYYFCQVNYAANSACPTLVSNAATIIVASDPLMSNPTSATYCQNAASVAPLTVNASGGINVGYAYQWYSNTTNSNTGGTPIAGATSNNYFPVVNQLGTTYYYCEVTQGSGCNAASTTAAVVVGVAANISQQPTASQNICLGQSATTLTVGVSAGNYALSYQWYSNVNNNNFGGTLIVGATNAFYTPPSTVLGTKYYYCVISVAGGGCGTLTSNTATINVLSAPSMFQPNNQTVCCQIGSAPITFVGNASNYNWTATGSSPLLTGYNTSGTGDIPTLTLTNNSTTPQNVVYLVTPSNQGCNGTPVQFSINVMPCLSVSTPSDQYYCAQNTVSSYVFSGVGSSFNWVNSNPAIGLQNAGVNFVPNFVAQNTTTTTQTATITVTPSFMGCAGTPQSYTITVYPLPIIDAGVDQAVCAGGSVTLSASGAPSLTWNNGITNGQTFIPNSSTTYTVTGTDANGCQSQDAVFVQVNQPTSATLNITACDSYTLNGQTYTQSGTYDQLLSNSAGCDSSLTLNLSLNFSPSQPNVYVQNQVNLSTDLIPGLTYQWITCSDLTPIAGQTAITYNPNSNGVYAVVVTNSCGSDTSLCASITTIGLEENAFDQITLYPNPNNGSFSIEIPENLVGKQAKIYDMQGRLLEVLMLEKKNNQIEVTNFARGAYWLQIEDEVPLKWIKN